MSRHSTKFIVDWTFYTKKIKKKKNRERERLGHSDNTGCTYMFELQ